MPWSWFRVASLWEPQTRREDGDFLCVVLPIAPNCCCLFSVEFGEGEGIAICVAHVLVQGFDTGGNTHLQGPTYNALEDPSLRQHFANKTFNKHLQQHHLIDRTGRILDLDKHKSKLRIIDQV